MQYRLASVWAGVAALTLFGSISTAQATILGSSPEIDFKDASTSFSIGDATYNLFNDSTRFDQVSISTEGSAQILLLGTPPNVPNVPGSLRAGTSLPTRSTVLGPRDFSFKSFETATSVASISGDVPFLGLKFSLDDGIHYGYAQLDNSNTLLSFAYNDAPGGSIDTGAAIEAPIDGPNGATPVPEPSSLGIIALALGLIGFGVAGTRRRSNASGTEAETA